MFYLDYRFLQFDALYSLFISPQESCTMSDDKGVTEQPSYDLSNFKISEILLNNTRSKTITLLGIFPDLSDEDKAIVVLEKSAFGSDSTEDSVGGYFSQETSYKAEFINNIYGNFEGLPPKEINSEIGPLFLKLNKIFIICL